MVVDVVDVVDGVVVVVGVDNVVVVGVDVEQTKARRDKKLICIF